MALLKNIHKNGNTRNCCEYFIKQTEALIGRNTECDIRIKNVEISRRHARLIKINDVWQLIDLKSTNGVYVNGDKIKPLVPKSLCNKHIISFGPPERTDFVYRFYQNVEDYKVKADKKRIKLVEKQIEEHSLSEEMLKKKIKQEEMKIKKKDAEILNLTEKLKAAEKLRHEAEIKRKNEEFEKQKVRDVVFEQWIELHELKRKESLNEVSNEAKDVTGLNEPEADAGVYGQQKKRKYGNLENG